MFTVTVNRFEVTAVKGFRVIVHPPIDCSVCLSVCLSRCVLWPNGARILIFSIFFS